VLEKLTVPQLVKKCSHFMQPLCSLSYPQQPVICLYLRSDGSSSSHPNLFS